MKVVSGLLGLLAMALMTACQTGPSMPASTPDRLPSSVVLGRSHKLSSGSHMAYWLWKDDDSVWHLRVTTQRVRHTFQGLVRPLNGTAITSLEAVSPKRRDELSLVDGTVIFDFHPHDDVDGIDFRVAGPEALEFALKIDGDYDPTHVFLGRDQKEPGSAHFILTP